MDWIGTGEKNDERHEHREEIYSAYASTIYALTAAIDTKDHYTFNHSKNVAYYASELAYATGLDADTVEIIREAGLLHDVGKIGIPETVLNKPGKLTEEEFEIMIVVTLAYSAFVFYITCKGVPRVAKFATKAVPFMCTDVCNGRQSDHRFQNRRGRRGFGESAGQKKCFGAHFDRYGY